MAIDVDHWMRYALALAERGRGFVEPNPMVGAVVLAVDGTLVGEGWHRKFGGPHAEVFALAEAGERARGGTLVVTLEPCCHHGKTPPCTDAVVAAGVARVVVAMADPFPKVAGGGIAQLRDAGIAVDVGVCEAEAAALNRPFLKRVATGKPWVVAKWAMSLDGKIATRTGDSKWISGPESRAKVHELRGRVDAVLVGRGTVLADDPLLTARPPGPRIATRVVVTGSGKLPAECQLTRTAREFPTLVYVAAGNEGNPTAWAAAGVEVVPLDAISPTAILADLGRRGATNVLVEGGGGLLGSFVDAGEIDEVWAFVAPVVIGGPGASPVAGSGVERLSDALALTDVQIAASGHDTWIRGIAKR